MGACNSSKNNNSKPNSIRNTTQFGSNSADFSGNINVYGISKFGTKVEPVCNNYPNELLKFEVRMSNFKGKSLPEDKYYFLKVVFGAPHYTEYVPVASGINPKFKFDKTLTINIKFENLEKTYMAISLFSMLKTTKMSDMSDLASLAKKLTPISRMNIDLLTIAIGPEHHDLRLLDLQNKNSIGRLSFNISCSHIENIEIKLKHFRCKITDLWKNELCFKLRYRESNNLSESDYTKSINPEHLFEEEATHYKWYEDDKNSESLILSKQLPLLSVTELRGSNLSISIYDLKYVEHKNVKNLNANNVLEESMGNVSKKDDKEGFAGLSSSKLKRFSYNSNNEKQIELAPKYKFMGYSNLNFYKILSKNDAMLLRQSSKIFQSYSPLYFQNNQEAINLNNLAGNAANEANNHDLIKCSIYEDLENHFSEDIVSLNGRVIGNIEGLIQIKKIPLIKQIMCGVHTENGFDISSINLHNPQIGTSPSNLNGKIFRELPNDLKAFISIKNKLIEKFFPSSFKHMEEMSNDSPTKHQMDRHSFTMERRIRSLHHLENSCNLNIDPKETMNLLNDVKNLLKKSCKESLLIFNLIHRVEILIAQKEMIDLGINLINILTKEVIIDARRTVVFDILVLLFNRAEIDLRLMAFDWKTEIGLQKLEVCRDFIELLNKTLAYTLDKLVTGKTADLDTNEFVEFFLSVAYFRIPVFRKKFINTINKGIPETDSIELFKLLDKDTDNMALITKSTSKINSTEYSQLRANENGNENVQSFNDLSKDANLLVRGKSMDMEDGGAENAIDVNPINTLLDWESLFYDKIEKLANSSDSKFTKEIQDIIDKMRETENIIDTIEWKSRINKRGNAFFSMIIRLEKYIQSKVILLRNISWTKIPGFKFIINAIIHELKVRQVAEYQDPLVKLLTVFINDSDISNLFINTVIRRTNVNDVEAVFMALKIVHLCFTEYEKKTNISCFSVKFDYNILKQAANIIFQNDHSLCVSKLIWLYYKNGHDMIIDHVHEFVLDLYRTRFFKLFFHWSWQVRNMFYYFVLFFLNHRIKFMILPKSKMNRGPSTTEATKRDHEFLENLRTEISEGLRRRLDVIDEIRVVIEKQRLNPTFNKNFDANLLRKDYQRVLTQELCCNIVVSMRHFNSVEEQYNEWLISSRKKNIYDYPDIVLKPQKDDVVQIADHW